jgi:hypothetical protein
MKLLNLLTVLTVLTTMTSCDPVHNLRVENQADRPVEILYSPNLNEFKNETIKADSIVFNGRHLKRLFLADSETIIIGTVYMRFTPLAKDIDIDYLEIRNGSDTLRLIGKHAILTTLQKVKKLDFRLIIK